MTSRPPLGIQRQPQRSLSVPGLSSRPTTYRSLSQNHQSSPTIRTENYVDLTFDGSDASQTRNNLSKIGRSRLNIEISKDPKNTTVVPSSSKGSEVASDLRSLPPPRGKPTLQFSADLDAPDYFDFENTPSAPSSARRFEKSSSQVPLPLPKRPAQAIPSSVQRHKVDSRRSGPRRDARPKPYVLEVPSSAPRYPPNGMLVYMLIEFS